MRCIRQRRDLDLLKLVAIRIRKFVGEVRQRERSNISIFRSRLHERCHRRDRVVRNLNRYRRCSSRPGFSVGAFPAKARSPIPVRNRYKSQVRDLRSGDLLINRYRNIAKLQNTVRCIRQRCDLDLRKRTAIGIAKLVCEVGLRERKRRIFPAVLAEITYRGQRRRSIRRRIRLPFCLEIESFDTCQVIRTIR